MEEALRQRDQVGRRAFLLRAAAGLAAAVGLGSVARNHLLKGGTNPFVSSLAEDSIFMPREDQRDRVLRGK